MNKVRLNPIAQFKEMKRQCETRNKEALENASFLQRMAFCLSGIGKAIVDGFSAQKEYPLGRIIER